MNSTAAEVAVTKILDTEAPNISSRPLPTSPPITSVDRLALTGTPNGVITSGIDLDQDSDVSELSATVLYLAYGSNLCAQTFLGRRGIRPLSQINVEVPGLVLTFDVPGMAYAEPCFANVARLSDDPASEKEPLLPIVQNSKWSRGLIGVAYEVTREDFAKIIATEGGGSSYQDVIVTCFPLAEQATARSDTAPFKAHTLLMSRGFRPNRSYAQPAARYLGLLRTGAAEHKLPSDYQKYLASLQPYTPTSARQTMGKIVLGAIFYPLILFLFTLMRIFRGKDGRSPKFLQRALGKVFQGGWMLYDYIFRPIFGDGERTEAA